MTIMRFLTTDSATGRFLTWGRGVLEILIMLVTKPSRRSWYFARMILKVKPRFTMVNNANLIHLYETLEDADKEGLPGAIVECGVWNGGSSAMMALGDKDTNGAANTRPIWLFDSFEGLPPPKDNDDEKSKKHYFEGMNKGAMDNVREIYQRMDLSLDKVTMVKGWFDDTLEKTELPEIAILHIDADWYDPVKLVLKVGYPKVVPGGYVILNDYGFWEGCDRAVADYFKENGLPQPEIIRVGRVGGYFRKPA